VVAGAAVAPRVIEQFVVGLDIGAGQALFPDKLLQRGCGENPPRQPQAADDGARVGFLRQIAMIAEKGAARQRLAAHPGPAEQAIDRADAFVHIAFVYIQIRQAHYLT
jgi:hypothetical protein